MKKMINTITIEGRVYSHKLDIKTVKNKESKNFGTEFIQGSLSVATDEAITNIVEVYYTYVPATRNGQPNQTFNNLKSIIETEEATYLKGGTDNCTKVKLSTSINVNDFWSDRENRIITSTRPDGGFVNIVNTLNADENKRRQFTAEIFITGVKKIEAVEDGQKDMVKIKGAVFDFRNALIPFEPISYIGVDWFEDLVSDGPKLIKIFGVLDHCNVTIEETEEGMFGTIVTTREKRKKDWVITNVSPTEYDFSEESAVLTPAEIEKAIQDREVHKAEVKKNYDDYQAQKNTAPSNNAALTGIKIEGFPF